MKELSPAEKNDVLLTLALAFEKKFSEAGETVEQRPLSQLIENLTEGNSSENFENLRLRAAFIEELPEENRAVWQSIWLDKLRRRGKALRLDENINPAHIVNVLSREPRSIQTLILRNLPADLSRKIAIYLDLNFDSDDFSAENGKLINAGIVAHIRKTFLANFVALEDVSEPHELDKFSVAELSDFVRQISLREMAIACRGISSKETLAAFLNRFDEEDARGIARYLTELERVRPFWVAQADELVRQTWRTDLQADKLLRKLGLKLLAIGFIERDETAKEYTAQKLSTRDSRRWRKFAREYEKQFQNAEAEEKTILERRKKMIEKLAAKFIQTDNL